MSCMRKSFVVSQLVLTLLFAFGLSMESAHAADITWGGNYRIEAVKIKNPELNSESSNKAYLLNHLTLMPKIVAADGVTIYSRLDIMNSPSFGVNPNGGAVYSVAGDVLGRGPNSTGNRTGTGAAGDTSSGRDSNAWSRTEASGTLAITSLYASWVQEFGQLVVGRMPMQFGLGTAFNAGTGLFDHYIDTKDLVGYKIVFGNLFVMPILGKVHEGAVGDEDDINDYLIHVQYDNPETELSLGAIYQIRVGTYGGNDTPVNSTIGRNGNTPPTVADGFKNTLIGLFSSQKAGNFRIGLEADLLSGDTGLRTSDGRGVGLNSYGIAGELGYNPPDSKWSGLLKVGMASGDDPGTADTYEGFAFSRNYDVGLLMFNHPLGTADTLRTGLIRGTNPATPVRNEIDSEAISNAIYIAPSLQFRTRDNLSWGGTVVYGMLNKDPIGNGANTPSSLGYELDLNVTYKPLERLTWVTEVGGLFPGEGWKSPDPKSETKFAYGIVTKAAISF